MMKVADEKLEAKQIVLERDSSTLRDRYLGIRQYTEEICKPLETEDYIVQLSPEACSPKWHLAHTTWFFENFILETILPGYRVFHPQYGKLFSGIDEITDSRWSRSRNFALSRPTVAEVIKYRHHVDDAFLSVVDELPDSAGDIVEIAIQHEQQHQERLFADIKFILGHNPLFPPYKERFSECLYNEDNPEFSFIPEGEYSIGYKGYGFSFDNEHAAHPVMLKPYAISKSLVTNREYLAFINSGGYQSADYWHSDGWEWVRKNRIDAPLYWMVEEGEWKRYALSGLEVIELNEPVTHVSFYEASAYASWKRMRLPTEFEWEAAAEQFRWGQRWEHTNSAYLPYPGYVKTPGGIAEYNGKFMVNTMVLRGASVVTPPNHSRKTYRNFIAPDQRIAFSGIRLCRDQEVGSFS